MTRPLFVSWVGEHGRSTGLAEAFGAECVFVSGAPGLPTPVRYVHHALRTALLLARRRPSAVVVMLPPLPLLIVVTAYARLTGARVVGDLHSGVFNNRQWAWALRPTLALLRRHMALVTTTAIQRRSEAAHVRTLVLHDLLAPLPPGGAAPTAGAGPTVLFPASYYADEPVDALLAAASLVPEAHWVLTGRAPEGVRAAAPANVRFTGFVSTDDYLALVHAADVVLALTTRELTMQRAAYEAICAGRPLVASGTDTLREFFGDAAYYADPTAESIAGAVRAALADPAGSSSRLAAVLTERTAEQQAALAEVRAVLNGGPAAA